MKKIVIIILSVLISLSLGHNEVRADIGPKPEINIHFEDDSPEGYVVFLSESKNFGPNGPLDVQGLAGQYPQELLESLEHYQDSDGLVIWRIFKMAATDSDLHWGYYAPEVFKIAMFDGSGKLIGLSDRMERDKFSAYYLCRIEGQKIILSDNYDYGREAMMLVLRVAATIIIELLVGLAFGYRKSSQIKCIIIVNLITQILLNLAIMLTNIYEGYLATLILLVPMEVVVFVIEGFIYMFALKDRKWKAWLYSLVANALTAVLGMWLIAL